MHIARHRKTPLAVLLAACLCTTAFAAGGGFSSLEERMSYKEFTEYGLDKLAPEQLRGLNEWLRNHGSGSSSVAAVAYPSSTPQASEATPPQIVSRLADDFNGWHQGTILTLENGQHWEVRDDDTVYAHDASHPRVTIEQGGIIGGWRLTLEGHNDIAHVVPVSPK
ncbi:MAG TPA: hypothetical protein VIE67_00470 [Rudaea sp.]|jgi:hypothetical protein|uniref:hypothetical protein n=1 Tax=Rudaea sp. TaxID=2136325 RepID=UPI002F92DC81